MRADVKERGRSLCERGWKARRTKRRWATVGTVQKGVVLTQCSTFRRHASNKPMPPLTLRHLSLSSLSLSLFSLFFPFFCLRPLNTYTATTTIQPAIIGVWVADKSGGVAAELARAVVSGSLGWEKLTAAKQPAHSTTKVTRGSFFRFFLLVELRACRESFW